MQALFSPDMFSITFVSDRQIFHHFQALGEGRFKTNKLYISAFCVSRF